MSAPVIVHGSAMSPRPGPPYVTFERRSETHYVIWIATPEGVTWEDFKDAVNAHERTHPGGLVRFLLCDYFHYPLTTDERELYLRYLVRDTGPEFWQRVEEADLLHTRPGHGPERPPSPGSERLARLVELLGGGISDGLPDGRGYLCTCPAHPDTERSLHLWLGYGDRICAVCLADCDPVKVTAALARLEVGR